MAKTVNQIKAELKDVIDEILNDFNKYKKKGFKLNCMANFVFEAGSKLVEAVETVKGISGPQKKEFVMVTVKEIYKKVNPNIPFIPEPFETMMEDVMLDKALGSFVDFIVSKYNDKGLFE